MRTIAFLTTIVLYNFEIIKAVYTSGIIFSLMGLTYIVSLYYPSFHSRIAQKVLLLSNFLVFWFSAWLFSIQITGKLLGNSLIAFLFCTPLVYLIFNYRNPKTNIKLVLMPFNQINKVGDLVDKLECIRYFMATKNTYENSSLMHEIVLSTQQENFSLEEQFNLYIACRTRNYEKYIETEASAIKNLVNSMYEKGLKKFNNDLNLAISHACYLIELDMRENQALEKVIQLESRTNDFNTLYIIQSLKDHVMQVQRGIIEQLGSSHGSGEIHQFEQIMNKRLEDKLNNLMLRATQSVSDLYQMLDEEGLLIKRIKSQLIKVAICKSKLEEFWLSYYKIFMQKSEVMEQIYFLFSTIYDKEKIGDIVLRDVLNNKRDARSLDRLKNLNLRDDLSHISDPIMTVKLLENDLIIDQVNKAVLKISGYQRKDLLGRLL